MTEDSLVFGHVPEWVTQDLKKDRSGVDIALQVLEERYAVAMQTDDYPTLAGDLVLMGNVLLDAGDADQAQTRYDRAVEMMNKSDAPQDNKDNFARNHLYREARVAQARGDLETARAKSEAYGGLPVLRRVRARLPGLRVGSLPHPFR